MKKYIHIAVILLAVLMLAACGSSRNNQTSKIEIHRIGYPNSLPSLNDDSGADSFANELDDASSKYFVIKDYFNMKSEGTLHLLSGFETYQQTTEYTCGCAAALMALHYLGIDDYNEFQIAEIAHTDEHTGSTVDGLQGFFEKAGVPTSFHAGTDSVFETYEEIEQFFIEQIDAGRPVLVDWEDFGGHWQVVIGIDTCNSPSVYDDVLIVADPYDVTDHYQDGYGTYQFGRFASMWKEGACIGDRTPLVQPYIVVSAKQEKSGTIS